MTKESKGMARTTHTTEEAGGTSHHVVSIGDLRVMVVPDGNGWFAQGLEVDYSATGDTVEDVRDNFAKGIALTIHEHLKRFNSIANFFVPAPRDAWQELLLDGGARPHEFTLVSYHRLESSSLPFARLAFFQKERAPESVPA